MSVQISQTLLATLTDAEALYQEAPCGYLSFLPDGTIIKINNTLLNWLEFERSEILNRVKFSSFLSKGGNMHFEMFFRPLVNMNGSVKELSYDLIKKNGKVFPVLVSASAIKEPSGTILAINAAIYNITERKKYEKELLLAKKLAEVEKKRFLFLTDLIPEIIWTAKQSGSIDYVNYRFYEYFNLQKKEINTAFILSKIHLEDRKSSVQAWKESLKNGTDLQVEVRLKNRLDNYEWHQLKASPYVHEDQTIKWFGSCTNIEAHVNALKRKDEFISIASHELKTPITSLKASLQFLHKLKDTPSSQLIPGLIDRANKSVNKISSLIGDLLNVGQIGQGQLQLNKTNFAISDLLAGCCSQFPEENNCEILIEGDINLEIYADESRIEQVLLNLISNAMKYASTGKEIKVYIEKLSDAIKISISDKGPGIPLSKTSNLFERYFRVEGGESKYAGLGLGLYICSEIIKKHEGTIGVESELGQGSTFWFTLPLASTPH